MGKREEKIASLIKSAAELGLNISDDLMTKVAIGAGPSLYNNDASSVACTQEAELETVKNNFLKKKLGLTNDDAELDAAIQDVCTQLGSSNRNKQRVHFYALLTMKFQKESVYA